MTLKLREKYNFPVNMLSAKSEETDKVMGLNIGADDYLTKNVEIILRNMSAEPLHISGERLTERFVRGDKSRNTEGSGLGLAIAKSFVEVQEGTFDVIVDGDLFKIHIVF